MNGNKILPLFLFVCFSLILSFVMIPSPVRGAVGDLTISTPAANPSQGSTFTSEITVDVGTRVVGAYDVVFTFNRNVLQIQTVGAGAPELGTPVDSGIAAANTNGWILVNALNAASLTAPTGIVDLFSITFQVVGAPGTTSTLQVAITSFWDVNFSDIPCTPIDSQVTVASPPIVVSFTATPSSITAGETATLAWNVTGATTVTIGPGIGTVDPSGGTTVVSPAATTTYTLTATNAEGSVTAHATVIVIETVPTLNRWGMILMGLAVVCIAFLTVRKRDATTA